MENRLTGEPESDWNMTGIPQPSSSSHPFLCKETHSHILPPDVGSYFVLTDVSLTFRVELSGLQTCSSACPALSAGWRCQSGLAAETSAAAHFPDLERFSEDQFHTTSA